MELEDIKQHWRKWAEAGVDLRATTKTVTIKQLEIAALVRAIRRSGMDQHPCKVLEGGCGNGQNCIALARALRHFTFDGFDYVDTMVQSARSLAATSGFSDRTRFVIGDLLDVATCDLLPRYDIVFTDRAIINLNTEERQLQAISSLASRVSSGGLLLLLENFSETYDRQNDCRELLGLPRRTPAEFNRFLSGERVEAHVRGIGFDLIGVDDFGSLHDLLLYVLLPAVNDGRIDYDNRLVTAAAELCERLGSVEGDLFGSFGQNRLYAFQRPVNRAGA
jgi:predicted O-methyltransferase YrrM